MCITLMFYIRADLPVEGCGPRQPACNVTVIEGPRECLWQGGVKINLRHPLARCVVWGGWIYHLDQVGVLADSGTKE